MTYIPTSYINDQEPYLEADNLNKAEQGIALAVERANAAKLAADTVKQAYDAGMLKGEDGVPGKDGKDFHVDGTVTLLSDLPPPDTVPNQWWVSYEFGHLHHSDGTQWNDVSQFVGIKGEDGKDGIIDFSKITESQLQQLRVRLEVYDPCRVWPVHATLAANKETHVPIADSNLKLVFKNVSGISCAYYLHKISNAGPSLFLVKRLTEWDATLIEGKITTGSAPLTIPNNGYQLDDMSFFAGREHIRIQISDVAANTWYSVEIFGSSNGELYIECRKHGNSHTTRIMPID